MDSLNLISTTGRNCPNCGRALLGQDTVVQEVVQTHYEGNRILENRYGVCAHCLMLVRQIKTEAGWFGIGTPRRFRIALDLDGVIADLPGEFVKAISFIYLDEGENFYRSGSGVIQLDNRGKANYSDRRRAMAHEVLTCFVHEELCSIFGLGQDHVESLFESIITRGNYPIIPDESEIKELTSVDSDIAIISSRPLDQRAATVEWLVYHKLELPFFTRDTEIANRFLTAAHVYVEDRYKPIFDIAWNHHRLRFILFDRPWNQYESLNLAKVSIRRAHSWRELINILREYRHEYEPFSYRVLT